MVFIACGTVAVDYSADFQGPDDVTLSIDYRITGELAEMAKESPGDDDVLSPDLMEMEADGWSVEVIENVPESLGAKVSKRFQGEDALQLLSGAALDTDNQVFELRMLETDTGDSIEYRIEIPAQSLKDFTTDAEPEDSSADTSDDIFGSDMEDWMLETMKDMLDLDISLIVFGEIVETNAHDQLDNRVSWKYDLKTSQEVTEGPYVITRVKKNTGLFGACSNTSTSQSNSSDPSTKSKGIEATVVTEKPTTVPTLTPTVTVKPASVLSLPMFPAVPTPPQLTPSPAPAVVTLPTLTSTAIATVTPTHVPIPTPTLMPTTTPTFTPTPTLVLPGKSRQKPIALGQTLHTDYGVNLEVLSLNYDAWGDNAFLNQFNSPPEDGMKYVLVDVKVEVVDGYLEDSFDISFNEFGAVASGVVYEGYCSNALAMELLGLQLYNEGKSSGVLCFEVPREEQGLTLFYEHRDADFNSTKYWLEASYDEKFSVIPTAPTATSTLSPTPTITPTPIPEVPVGTIYIEPSLLNYFNQEGMISYGGEQHIYSFRASLGQTVFVHMSSSQIEPSIQLFDPSGESIAHQYTDYRGAGANYSEDALIFAQIPVQGQNTNQLKTLPMSGIYQLAVKSMTEGLSDIGLYTLTVRINAGPTPTPTPSPTPALSPTPTPSPTPSPETIYLTGSGNTELQNVDLAAGFRMVELTHTGTGYFIATVLTENGVGNIASLANDLDYSQGTSDFHIGEAGQYVISVVATGDWSITIR